MLRHRTYIAEPKPLPPGGGRAVAPDELAERRRRLEREFGTCPNCDALYPRGAAFCSQCAHPLMR